MSEGPPQNQRDRMIHARDIFANEGIHSDPFNHFMTLKLAGPSTNFTTLPEVPPYEEYIRGRPELAPHADFIMEASDPKKVQAFNELARKYNKLLPTIRKFRDFKRLNELAREAQTLLRGK